MNAIAHRAQEVRRAQAGLGAYLALLIAFLAGLLTLVLTLVTESTAVDQLRAGLGSNLAELANQTTSRLDRSMFERYREAELMTARLSSEYDLGAIRAELDALQYSYPYYAWIGVTDEAGIVKASTKRMLEGADVSKRPWFINVKKDVHLGDVHEALLLAKLLQKPGDEPLRFVDIAFRLQDPSGAPRGVLGVHLSWAWAKDVRQAIFVPVGRSRAVEPLIIASNGNVLLGPPDIEGKNLTLQSVTLAAAGGAGYRVERFPDGREYLVGYAKSKGYSRYPGIGWSVLVREELTQAMAPVRELQHRMLAGGIALAALFSVLGWLAARAITRPLLQLALSARKMEAGDATEVETSFAYREVSALGQALNSLVRNLQQKETDMRELNQSLERRVQDRTAELQEAFDQVNDNQRRIQTIIETAQDPFVGFDLNGRITDWNTQAQRRFGWSRDEVLGVPLAQTLLPERSARALQIALKRFARHGDAAFLGRTIEQSMLDRDRNEVPVEVKIGLIDTGRERFFSAFLHDLSERKQIDRLKDEFLSTASHELRTPMTAIYGSLNLMQAGMAGDLPPSARKLVDLSAQSCDRLIRLINDMLDVEKIQSGRMDYDMRKRPLHPLIEQALREVKPFADGYGVQLNFLTEIANPDALQIVGDGDRIVQVVVNLLSNAAKFSPRDGAVEVALTQHDGVARVAVVDRGPGVPPAFHDRIFERFTQADASDRRQKGGTGLGLNICRSIIEAHHGRIGFSSEPDVRTEFYFELPLG